MPNCPSTNLYPTLNNILSAWPINLIISESDELILKSVFRVILLCRSLLYDVSRLEFIAGESIFWSDISNQEDKLKFDDTFPEGHLHKLSIMKANFHHFLTIILQYVTTAVIDPYLAIFNEFLTTSKQQSLHQVYIAHKELLKRIARNLALPCEMQLSEHDFFKDATEICKTSKQNENLLKLYNDMSIYNCYEGLDNSSSNQGSNQSSKSTPSPRPRLDNSFKKLETLSVSLWLCIYKQMDLIHNLIGCKHFNEKKMREFERASNIYRSNLKNMIKNLRQYTQLPFLSELGEDTR